jgi:RNA polymerase sigma factor (sigma-70 family)
MSPASGKSSDVRLDEAASARAHAARLQALDREAWKALYLENRRLVRGILASRVGYGAELEDLTQQVFATAATLVRDGKTSLTGAPSGLRAWLAAIAHRLAFSERRRQRNERGTPRFQGDDGTSEAPVDPEARQILRHARALWEKLPEGLRSPWLLRHLEHMTIDEIALTLSISAATVKRRIGEADQRFAAMADQDPVLRDYVRAVRAGDQP